MFTESIFTYWYMFPIGIVIATIAMSAGIGGAAMFSPLFLLALRLPPPVVVGLGLAIEIFGFGSGLVGFARAKMIVWPLGKRMLYLTIPSGIAGAAISRFLPGAALKVCIAVVLLILSSDLLRRKNHVLVKHPAFHTQCISTAKGHMCYDAEHASGFFLMLTALGGMLVGLASMGLGEINEFNFLKRLRMEPAIAAGTSVFVVAVTALTGALIHGLLFLREATGSQWEQIGIILLFTAPGVVAGGQIGVRIASRINQKLMRVFVGILFFLLAMLLFWGAMR